MNDRRATESDERFEGDEGSAVVTLVMLFPILVMFVELIVIGGRLAATHADVQSAAREAARQASVAGGPASAGGVIDTAVDVALDPKGFQCENPSVGIGGGTNFVPGGQVEVQVTCTVRLSDLGFLSVPGTVQITKSALEPIDYYRVVN